jgi:hypothetical protein
LETQKGRDVVKNFAEMMKKKIRKSTGQGEPYTRPGNSEEEKEEKRPGMFSEEEMKEMNEARRKRLKDLARRKK